MRPPGILLASRVYMMRIYAHFFEFSGYPQAFFHFPTTEKIMGYTVPIDNWEVRTNRFANSLYCFTCEIQSVFAITAVLVIPTVPECRHELVKQVTLVAVQFDAVNTSLFAAQSGFSKCLR
jgi:hypothetical protein